MLVITAEIHSAVGPHLWDIIKALESLKMIWGLKTLTHFPMCRELDTYRLYKVVGTMGRTFESILGK